MKRSVFFLMFVALAAIVNAQSGGRFIVDNLVAGGLSDQISSPWEVKSLVIKGEIDKRDFDFIKTLSSMDSLYLEETQIAPYDAYAKDEIPREALKNLGNLKYISLPDVVAGIGTSAFESCGGLTSISFPANIKVFGDSVFRNCYNLKYVITPDHMGGAIIGISIFENCSSLLNFTIPDGIERIEDFSFKGCGWLMGIDISESVTTIGKSVFEGCSSLNQITLPKNLSSIEDGAFSGTQLTKIYCNNPTPPAISDENAFGSLNKDNCTIYVPTEAAKEAYSKAPVWKEFLNIEVDTTTGIGDKNFDTSKLNALIKPDYIQVTGVVGQGILSVVDLNGKTILSRSVNDGEAVSTGNLATGLYVLKIKDKENVFTQKFIMR
ncbi:MAG: leucine-rich repeat domain-containing protein [Dysgonomonas sp.]